MFKFLILPSIRYILILLLVFPKSLRKTTSFCQSSIFPVVQTENLGVLLNVSSTSTSKLSILFDSTFKEIINPATSYHPTSTTEPPDLCLCFCLWSLYSVINTEALMTLYRHTLDAVTPQLQILQWFPIFLYVKVKVLTMT